MGDQNATSPAPYCHAAYPRSGRRASATQPRPVRDMPVRAARQRRRPPNESIWKAVREIIRRGERKYIREPGYARARGSAQRRRSAAYATRQTVMSQTVFRTRRQVIAVVGNVCCRGCVNHESPGNSVKRAAHAKQAEALPAAPQTKTAESRHRMPNGPVRREVTRARKKTPHRNGVKASRRTKRWLDGAVVRRVLERCSKPNSSHNVCRARR